MKKIKEIEFIKNINVKDKFGSIMGTLLTVTLEANYVGFIEKNKASILFLVLLVIAIYCIAVCIKNKNIKYKILSIALIFLTVVSLFNTPYIVRRANTFEININELGDAIMQQDYDELYSKYSKNLDKISRKLGEDSEEYVEHKVMLAKLDWLKGNLEIGLNHLDDVKYYIEEHRNDMQELYYLYNITKADILMNNENYSEAYKCYELLEELFTKKPLTEFNMELYNIYTQMSKILFYSSESEYKIITLCEKIEEFEGQQITSGETNLLKNPIKASNYLINNIACNTYLSSSYMKFDNKNQATKYYEKMKDYAKDYVHLINGQELLQLSIVSNYLGYSEEAQFYAEFLKTKIKDEDVQLLELYEAGLNMSNMNFEEKEKHLLYCMNMFSDQFELVAKVKCKLAELYINESIDEALDAIEIAENYINVNIQQFKNYEELTLSINFLKYRYYDKISNKELSEKYYKDFKSLYKQVYNRTYERN